jgi:hypothetical protein
MPDNRSKSHGHLTPQGQSLPEAGWTKQATQVKGPLSGLAFGIRAAANMRAMQIAMRHAKVYGELMETAVDTIGKIQKAQDAAREYAARQELGGEFYENEIELQRDKVQEDRHQRALAAKRRTQESVKADTEILLARQTLRAKKKFEPLKHAIGEERFKTEAARRKVGAAEAQMATDEALKSQAPPQPEGSHAEPGSGEARAAIVSGLLEEVRSRLREMRADDEDSEKRQELLANEAALERMLAELLKGK